MKSREAGEEIAGFWLRQPQAANSRNGCKYQVPVEPRLWREPRTGAARARGMMGGDSGILLNELSPTLYLPILLVFFFINIVYTAKCRIKSCFFFISFLIMKKRNSQKMLRFLSRLQRRHVIFIEFNAIK